MKLSNSTIKLILSASLTIFTLILSLSTHYLDFFSTTSCQRYLPHPFLFISIFTTVTILGLFGLYALTHNYYHNWLYFLYLLFFFVFAICIFALCVSVLVVAGDGGDGDGLVVRDFGFEYREYELADYSGWFRKRVAVSKVWERVKSCLIAEGVCHKVANSNVNVNASSCGPMAQAKGQGQGQGQGQGMLFQMCLTPFQDVFFKKYLSPFESGCCKPPKNCGFTYVGPTTWNKTGTPMNPDCDVWENNPNTLCYNCTSCKAGFLQNVKSDWKKVAIVNIFFIVLLLIVYLIGCCSFCCNMRKNANQSKRVT